MEATPEVIVVGAGLSGLSCALELVERGRSVVVLESRPFVGGRTSSWTEADGMAVESGLHRVLGVYDAFPKLLRRAGVSVDDVVAWEDEVEFRPPLPARPAVFPASPLHHPARTAAGLLQHQDFLSGPEKAELMTFLLGGLRDYALRPGTLDQMTLLEYARKRGVSEPSIEKVLRPLATGIYFIPPERYSAYAFLGLAGPYVARAPKLRVGAFRGGMTEVMAAPIARAIERQGGTVRTGVTVDQLEMSLGRITGVRAAGVEWRAEHVVLALPLQAAQTLLRARWSDHPWFRPMLSLATMPAATFQLELDAPAMDADHTTFGVDSALACFSEQSRTTFPGTAGRLSAILGPAERFLGMSEEETLSVVLEEADRLGLRVRGHVLRSRRVNHPADFYALEPGQEAKRPTQETPIAGLTLAGDYTQQRYLASMEGAVVAGHLAAKAALKSLPRKPRVRRP